MMVALIAHGRADERDPAVPDVHAGAEDRDRVGGPAWRSAVRDVCREYEISEALYYQWRERLLEGGKTALATPRDKKPPEAAELAEARKKIAQLERALGRKTYELEIAGEALRDWDVNERVARSRALIAKGHRPAVVTRVLQVSCQSVYRPISRRPASAGPGRGRPDDDLIVEVAKANPHPSAPAWSPRWPPGSWVSQSTANGRHG